MIRPKLPDRATVYLDNQATGLFDLVAKRDLRCALLIPQLNPADIPERTENAVLRVLYFDPDYELPEQCRVVVGSTRWIPDPATIAYPTSFSGKVSHGQCTVVREDV